MMKRNLIILTIIVLAVVAGFIYFTKDEDIFSKETSMYKAVPVSAPVFIELSELKSIPLDNPMIKDLITADKDILFLNKVALLDSLIKNNNSIQSSLRNESMILAFDFVGEGMVFPLLVFKAEKDNKQKELRKFLSVLYPAGKFSYNEEAYSNHKITSITNGENSSVLHFCFTNGLFLASTKSLLIEEALRQLNTQSISDDVLFSKVNKTINAQSKISWYINHQTFPDLAALWLNGRSLSSVNEFGETVRSNYKNNFENFGKYAAWSELDMKLKENEIIFSGISTATDSLDHFMSVFEGQEPVRFQAEQVLPKNTSFFTSYSFSNKSLFFEKLEDYFAHTSNYYKREDRIKKIESGFRIDFKSTFQGLVKDEIIVATTTIPTETNKKTTLFIIPAGGKSDAEVQLNSLLNSYANRKKIEFESLKSTYEIDSETRFEIYKFPYPSFPGIWLGKPFEIAQARFVSVYENYLVFGNTEKGLQEYLYNMVLKSSLTKDLNYTRFKQNSVSRANINSYININRIFSLSQEVFNKDVSKVLEQHEELLRNFHALNWQVVCEKDIVFNSIHLALSQEIEEEAQTTWQSSIGNRISSKPLLVVNHKNKVNKEVVLQDAQNNLYQITNEGRIRWSFPVPEPILGKIHQVDYYKNGKLQYLFNTKSKLYLIDRDGNNVAHFPVSFSSPATNGVSVFDYDKNRKYRYFVACENKKVYAYDNVGKILNGWKFGQTDSPVTNPIQHFRVSNKDYIVFNDQSKIYIQHRNGVTRVKSTAKLEYSNNPLMLNLNGKPKIVATDNTGKVFYLYFDGKFDVKETDDFSDNHFFTIDDINGNGIPDFIFVDGKQLKVMDEKGKKLFSKKFKNEIQHRPNVYSFSSKLKKIGIAESLANRIHLLDPKGKQHKGFPMPGNSEFTIGEISENSGELNLIVGSKGGDLYNYTLN